MTENHEHTFSHGQSIRAQALKIARDVLVARPPFSGGTVIGWTTDDFIKIAEYIIGTEDVSETEWERELRQELGHWVPAPECPEEHEFGAEGWRPTTTDVHEHWVSLSDEVKGEQHD